MRDRNDLRLSDFLVVHCIGLSTSQHKIYGPSRGHPSTFNRLSDISAVSARWRQHVIVLLRERLELCHQTLGAMSAECHEFARLRRDSVWKLCNLPAVAGAVERRAVRGEETHPDTKRRRCCGSHYFSAYDRRPHLPCDW